MNEERIEEYWKRKPFVAFDIRTADGRVYTVDHPDFLSKSRDGRRLYFITEDDRQTAIAMLHIVALETANRPTAA